MPLPKVVITEMIKYMSNIKQLKRVLQDSMSRSLYIQYNESSSIWFNVGFNMIIFPWWHNFNCQIFGNIYIFCSNSGLAKNKRMLKKCGRLLRGTILYSPLGIHPNVQSLILDIHIKISKTRMKINRLFIIFRGKNCLKFPLASPLIGRLLVSKYFISPVYHQVAAQTTPTVRCFQAVFGVVHVPVSCDSPCTDTL